MAYLTKEQFKTPKYTIPLFDTLSYSGFTNQPSDDAVEVASNNAADTQTCTIIGTSHADGALKYETITLEGTTVVETAEKNWGNVYGVFLGSVTGRDVTAATGIITIRKKTGSATITVIAAGGVSTGMVGFDLRGYNISVIHVSGNLYLHQGAVVTAENGYPFSNGEKLLIRPNDMIYLISDASGATSKILVFDD